MKNKAGVDLENYNNSVFQKFIEEIGKEKLQTNLNSFNKDLDFVMSVIAQHYCPTSLIVIHYSEENNGLEDLFRYINRVINPDKEVIELIEKKAEEMRLKLSQLRKIKLKE